MWYFKGRRKKYKSPYTGKEVDEAVAKADAIPETTVADAGKVMGVTPEGKIGLIDSAGVEEYTLDMDGLTLPFYQLIATISNLQAGDSKKITGLITKSNNETGYNNLKAALSYCAENEKRQIILKMNLGGTNTLKLQVSSVNTEIENEIVVICVPTVVTDTVITITYYLDESVAESANITVSFFATKYEAYS